MKDLSGKKFGKLLSIEPTKERKHGCVIWKCQCECGNITYVSSHSLISNNTKSCGCLNDEKRKERIKIYNNEFNNRNLLGYRFGKLIVLEQTEQRVSGRIVWKCQCDCGNIVYVSSNNLRENGGTLSCGCLSKEHTNYLDLTALEKTEQRKHGYIIWKCQCECGNITYVPSGLLTSGGTKSCGCLRSQGEEKIIKLLQENNIPYLKEYCFNTCKNDITNSPLYFDFYIDNKYVIEYDGIQHFKQTGWEPLEIIQQRDNMKNKWCKLNNIPIIRIPYTVLNKLTINDLLLETSKFIF